MKQIERVCELAKEGRKVLDEPPITRAASALLIMPELVTQLEAICRRDKSFVGLRDNLKVAVKEFKETMWEVRASNVEWLGVAVGAGPIQRAYNKMAVALTAIENALQNTED